MLVGGGLGAFADGGLTNVFFLIREPVNEGNGYRVGGVGTNSTEFDSSVIGIDNPPLCPNFSFFFYDNNFNFLCLFYLTKY
jgi:hypothetical protein